MEVPLLGQVKEFPFSAALLAAVVVGVCSSDLNDCEISFAYAKLMAEK